MGFVRFACFLLVALPVTSLSIINFHQDKDAAKELDIASVQKEFLANNIGGRRLAVKGLMLLESTKSLRMAGKKMVSRVSSRLVRKLCDKEEEISSGDQSRVIYNADYLTHMHHPPKHN